MSINRFETVRPQQYQSTYVPLPFEAMLKAGGLHQARIDDSKTQEDAITALMANVKSLDQLDVGGGNMRTVADRQYLTDYKTNINKQLADIASAYTDKGDVNYGQKINSIAKQLYGDFAPEGKIGKIHTAATEYEKQEAAMQAAKNFTGSEWRGNPMYDNRRKYADANGNAWTGSASLATSNVGEFVDNAAESDKLVQGIKALDNGIVKEVDRNKILGTINGLLPNSPIFADLQARRQYEINNGDPNAETNYQQRLTSLKEGLVNKYLQSDMNAPTTSSSGGGTTPPAKVPFVPPMTPTTTPVMSDQVATQVVEDYKGVQERVAEKEKNLIDLQYEINNKYIVDANGNHRNRELYNNEITRILQDPSNPATTRAEADEVYNQSGMNDNELYDRDQKVLESLQHDYDIEESAQQTIVANAIGKDPTLQQARDKGIIDIYTGEYDIDKNVPGAKKRIADFRTRLENTYGGTTPEDAGQPSFTPEEIDKQVYEFSKKIDPLYAKFEANKNKLSKEYGRVQSYYADAVAWYDTSNWNTMDDTNPGASMYKTKVDQLESTLSSDAINGTSASNEIFDINTNSKFDQNNQNDMMNKLEWTQGTPPDIKQAKFKPTKFTYTSDRGMVVMGNYVANLKGGGTSLSKEVGMDLKGSQEAYALSVLYHQGIPPDVGVKIIQNAIDKNRVNHGKLPPDVMSGSDVRVERNPDKSIRMIVSENGKMIETQTFDSEVEAGQAVSNLRENLQRRKVDTLLQIIGQQESANNASATNPNSTAVGDFQILFKGNNDLINTTAKELGIARPKDKTEFMKNRELYIAVGNKLAKDARVQSEAVKGKYKEFTPLQIAAGFYYLGSTGMTEWLETFKRDGRKAADAIIPGYADGTNQSMAWYMDKAEESAKNKKIKY